MSFLSEIVARHRGGEAVGVTSVCSSHPLVIEAAMRHAIETGGHLLLEATSNQVDQTGGYTGMTPKDYRTFVTELARNVGLAMERIVLGGDHLGPNRWQDVPADEAMENAEVLVAAYAEAGFSKIHLDCSMSCADDAVPLASEIVAQRAARLARVAEEAAARAGHPPPLYIVGTEVPVPGGAREPLGHGIEPTDPDDARRTLAEHDAAFAQAGVAQAFTRVVGLVVQPGVEFGHTGIVDYDRSSAKNLLAMIGSHEGLVFEAHSTDYQTRAALRALVEDHFAILKVGPGLTFAMREALFALEAIESELPESFARSNLAQIVDDAMTANPSYWQRYYEGDEREIGFARRFSFSDRIRYYWQIPKVEAAIERLFSNLDSVTLPFPLLSQYFPDQFVRIRDGVIEARPRAIVLDKITDVLRDYAYACTDTSTRNPIP